MNVSNLTKYAICGLALGLIACEASNPPIKSEGHLSVTEKEPSSIPEIVKVAPTLPKPTFSKSIETYTVIVNDVPIKELLFSMARDADINIDIDSDIRGLVSMNAIDQTLQKILDRLARQVNINYKMEDDTLHVMVDTPYLHIYNVNYLNMSRNSTGSVTLSTEISSTGGTEGGSGGNDSSTSVDNKSENEFWNTIQANIASIISEENKVTEKEEPAAVAPQQAGGLAASLLAGAVPAPAAPVVKEEKTEEEQLKNVIVNRESGIIAVRATSRQHEQITRFIDKVMGGAQRQVLIEATIAEVTLSDRYQAGIDWSNVSGTVGSTSRLEVSQSLLSGNLGAAPAFSAVLGDPTGLAGGLTATLRALETFGNVKVLSSPKIMALNNQTSLLKVVDNEVYFSIEVTPQITSATGAVTSPATVDTTINTVPVGFVMSVTPFIDENDVVTLNVRPTISRIISRVQDPNPELAAAGVVSEVPVVQVREIESVLKVNNGDTAVIGGLMQDQVNKQTSGVPVLSSIPLIGGLFSYQDDEYVKSELVIFIRPVVVHDASLTGDLKDYQKYLIDEL